MARAFGWLAGLAGVAMVVSGCAADAGREDDGAHTTDELGRRVGSAVVPTDQATLRLFGGYNSLLDEGYAPCVQPVASTDDPALSVGNVEEKFAIRYVESRVELANELGIDLGLGVKYGPLNARADFGFLDSYKQGNTSVSFLLSAKQTYSVTNLRAVRLTPDAEDLLTRDVDKFLQKCGDGYVNGLQYQAQLSVLIRYDAPSEETAREIKSDLSGGGDVSVAGKGATIDGNLKTKLVANVKRSGVTANVVVASTGFLVSGTSQTVLPLGNGITDETFAKIEQLREAMGKSIIDDVCRDGGDRGQCASGANGPGYEQNRSRNARAAGVLFGQYNKAENAPAVSGADNPYRAMQEKLTKTETFLRAFAQQQVKMENAYWGEIAPFLAAPAEKKYAYNVAPPGTALLQTDDVTRVAESWRAKFRPNDGMSQGSVMQQLDDVVNACWKNAGLGDYTDCHLDTLPAQLPEYKAIDAEIGAYVNTGRVLPLRFADEGRMSFKTDACRYVPNMSSARLPNASEIARLAPVIATLSRDGKAWYDDTTGSCKDQPLFSNPRGNHDASRTLDCHQSQWYWPPSWWTLETLCVPDNGPFGTIEAL